MDSMELYDRVIRFARNKNMTEPQLYKKAGISDGTLRSWKKKGSCPSIYVLEGLCYALDISLSRLFSDEDFNAGTAEQKQFLEEFDSLSKEQKLAIMHIMRAFKDS